MANLMLSLTMISLMASCLQICSPKPVDDRYGDEKSDSSGSGFVDKEGNKMNMTNPNISDDEDYNDESGSGSNKVAITEDQAWDMFRKLLIQLGFDPNILLNGNH